MCQLLGMNCNVPTDICFSFEGFSQRGGKTDEHGDGWGISFFEGKGCRTFMDINPSADSVVSNLVKRYPIKSLNVIAHIRKASVGEIKLENTHPFVRELWGEYWVFAHNGDLINFYPKLSGCYLPVGDTDSELAFCAIMETLKSGFSAKPDLRPRSCRNSTRLPGSCRPTPGVPRKRRPSSSLVPRSRSVSRP